MVMKKKMFAVLLCGCLMFTACGSEKETDTTNSGNREAGSLLNNAFGVNGSNTDHDSEDKKDPSENSEASQGNSDTSQENSGASENTGDSTDVTAGAYWAPQGTVVLGQYLGIEVDKVVVEVTEEEVQEEIEYFLEYQSELQEVTNRATIESGDTVNLDYALAIDGTEIETYDAYDVEIGSGEFPEIEEKLIGLSSGTTQEITALIVDEYNYPDYVGKEGVWTITINAIQQRVTPELSDELVAENTDYATVEEYKQGLYDELYASKEAAAADEQIVAVFEQIIANSTFSGLSDADIQSYADEMVSYYEEYAAMYGLDMESFITLFYGSTYEDFLQMAKEQGEYVVKQNLILEAVLEAEGVELTEQEYTEGLTQYAANYGYESPEEFEAAAGTEEVENVLLMDKVYDLIVDSIVVK